MKNFRRHITSLLQVLLLLILLAGSAGAALLDVGPIVPEVQNSSPPGHGFPLWYRDANRVPLELCLSQAVSPDPAAAGGTMCNLLPAPGFDPAQPLVFPTNFPDEAFWWAGDAIIKNGFIRASVIMAVEAAWGTGAIESGKQISFARIRFVVDTPVAGTYRIVFPYGVRTFTNVPAGVHAIFHSEDIGIADGVFDGALQGGIGPFLTWDSGVPITVGTEQFVGDPNIEHTITGSPFGTNYFRIEGPVGSNLDGLGHNFVQTNLFAITGKILSQAIPTAQKVDKATYALNNTGMQVSVFSTAQAVSNQTAGAGAFPSNFALTGTPSALQLSGTGITTQALTTNSPADGKFYAASSVFAAPVTFPTTVTVTNTADVPNTVQIVPLVDEVMISAATYNPLSKTLTLAASSLDKVNAPALQAFMPGITAPLGTLANGTLNVTFPVTDTTVTPNVTYAIPPGTITVTSAKGGTTAAALSIVPVPVVPATGATLTAAPVSPQTTGSAITFTAVATGGDVAGPYEYRFWWRKAGSTVWAQGQAYSTATTWTWNTAALGLSAGTYYIQVDTRHVGSTVKSEAAKMITYKLSMSPATGATLTPTQISPQPAGTAITLTAAATGGDVGPYEYRFWWRKAGSTVWAQGQAYSATTTWTWNTTALGLSAGTYYIQVDTRHVGSTVKSEAVKMITYKLSVSPATGATLTPAQISPQPAGTAITLTAAATGGDVGPYVYRFWWRKAGSAVWTQGQAYSTTATWTWNTTGLAAGTYYIQVDTRHVGSTVKSEAAKMITYGLTAALP